MSAVDRSAAYEWGFEKGEQAERERIIELINEKFCHMYGEEESDYCECVTEIETWKVIALIKGENK